MSNTWEMPVCSGQDFLILFIKRKIKLTLTIQSGRGSEDGLPSSGLSQCWRCSCYTGDPIVVLAYSIICERMHHGLAEELDFGWGNFQVSSQEVEHLVCLGTDVNVPFPFEVTPVSPQGHCLQGLAVEGAGICFHFLGCHTDQACAPAGYGSPGQMLWWSPWWWPQLEFL